MKVRFTCSSTCVIFRLMHIVGNGGSVSKGIVMGVMLLLSALLPAITATESDTVTPSTALSATGSIAPTVGTMTHIQAAS